MKENIARLHLFLLFPCNYSLFHASLFTLICTFGAEKPFIMFQIFIAGNILQRILDTAYPANDRHRSLLIKLLRLQKKVYVSSSDISWLQRVRTQAKINVDASLSSYIEDIVEHPETVPAEPIFSLHPLHSHPRSRTDSEVLWRFLSEWRCHQYPGADRC